MKAGPNQALSTLIREALSLYFEHVELRNSEAAISES
jgi:hypothetical protein